MTGTLISSAADVCSSGSRKINTHEQDADAPSLTSHSSRAATATSSAKLPQDQLQDNLTLAGLLVLPASRHGIHACKSSAISTITAAPTITLTTHESLHKHQIYKSDVLRGCFCDLGIRLATVPAFWGLYFPPYEKLKSHLLQFTQPYGDNSPNHYI